MAMESKKESYNLSEDGLSITDSTSTPSVRRDEDQTSAINSKHSEDNNEQDQDRGIVINASDILADLAAKKKRKKKSKRPGSERGLNKPTGFEDNFADAPLTAEQYAELKELYQPDVPFVNRILRAIHEFERTRKLSSQRRDIFFKYLTYSGFETGPNMFQGQQDVTEKGKEHTIMAMAQTRLSDRMRASIYNPKSVESDVYKDNQKNGDCVAQIDYPISGLGEQFKYIVDFHTTMCAFLSRRAPAWIGLDSEENINLVTSTLERFMDYLLQHDVCPEYAVEVLQTRNLCREARVEFKACIEAQRWLPGEFNIACSTLVGGSYGRDYDGQTYWGVARSDETNFVGLTPEKAAQIIGFAMATVAKDTTYQHYADVVERGGDFEVVKTIKGHGFEITRIERATEDCCEIYRTNAEEYRPVGKVHAKFWRNPDSAPEDLTDEERVVLRVKLADSSDLGFSRLSLHGEEGFTFFIEDSNIMPHLRTGQKVECHVYQMEGGFWFFDEVIQLYPSFDIWIENELVYDWKEPRPIQRDVNRLVGCGEEQADAESAKDDVPVDSQLGKTADSTDIADRDASDQEPY